jgi:protein-S-isoprenylcysteine O-methyltransferase Ste14
MAGGAGNMLSFKTAVATLVVPGIACLLIPYFILRATGDTLSLPTNLVQLVAILIFILGLYLVVWVSVAFVRIGQGTPIPIEPPTRLVIVGPYRYLRNPMYTGALLMVLAEALYFGSWWIVLYAAGLWAILHAFLVLLEEPQLQRRFGSEYENYLKTAPRWIPRLSKPGIEPS